MVGRLIQQQQVGLAGERARGELALLASLAAPAAYVPFFVQERYLAGALIPVTRGA